ncbi:hypothetical protein DYB35_008459 [Aphanomyces astaci]|uniref:heme oxygenase (biliverdin-producing) n=1 Tax=Aphanomyces astaci TaxID=112090 RepID=A0A418D1Z9_APHAT|nr:hypothetical protein DYB35_008459 [Aphanomyces astaci]
MEYAGFHSPNTHHASTSAMDPPMKEDPSPEPASVEENCPAFASGCPFASSKEKAAAPSLSECPFFAQGCPFKGIHDVQNLYTTLESSIPASHQKDGSPPNVLSMFKFIHDESAKKKGEIGTACPVFATTCPFKTIMVNGRALVDELDVRTWAIFADEEGDKCPVGGGHLADDLKYGTKQSHREAENVHFVREFVKGRINQDIYKVMVAMLYYIYSDLEAHLRSAAAANDPIFTPLHFPVELERQAALELDLAYYYGPSWRSAIPPPTTATQEYLARLAFIRKSSPSLLVAHAYTRYMGDLSGGQILKRTAIKAMGLMDGHGTAFYDFHNITTSHKAFKDMYRRTLNSLPATHDVSEQLVHEANVAFLLNMKVFEELDVLGGFNTPDNQQAEALVRRRSQQQQKMTREGTDVTKKGGPVCPFANMLGQPGIKELAIKYHGDDLTADEFAQLKAQVDAIRNAQWRRNYVVSMAVVGVAIGVGVWLRMSSALWAGRSAGATAESDDDDRVAPTEDVAEVAQRKAHWEAKAAVKRERLGQLEQQDVADLVKSAMQTVGAEGVLKLLIAKKAKRVEEAKAIAAAAAKAAKEAAEAASKAAS